jgi:hypothetical protein
MTQYCRHANQCSICNVRNTSTDRAYRFYLSCPKCEISNIIDIRHLERTFLAESLLCKVCKTSKPTIRLPICGHLCLCLDCLSKLCLDSVIENDTDVCHFDCFNITKEFFRLVFESRENDV